jgi:3-oxoadipate enol-lactonase
MTSTDINTGKQPEVQKLTLIDGVQLAYRYQPKAGRPVLMLSNSVGADMSMWQAQVGPLAEHFGILRYDTRGHGQSSSMAGAYSIDRLVCDAIELLDHLALEKVIFCGLSLGGMTGQVLSYRHPDRLESLILANTSAFSGSPSMWQQRIDKVTDEGLASLWSGIVTRWFSEDFIARETATVKAMQQMFEGTDTIGYIGCCAAIRDMDLRNIATLNHVRTLIIAGQYDLASPPELADYLLAKAKNAQLVSLPAGHLSNVECSEQFVKAIVDFAG